MEGGNAMNRISSSVACAFAALLVLSALPSPAGAIVNGTFDTTHDYVGALIVPNPGRSGYTGVQDFIWCSGTLIAPRVFLVAAHCFNVVEQFGMTVEDMAVSLAPNVMEDRKSWMAVDSYARHPDSKYYKPDADLHGNDVDIAVVILAKAVRNVRPAVLAPVGFLDGYPDLMSAVFPFLGYGLNETFVLTGDRRIATTGFVSMGPSWLQLDGNPGTICRFDSGGPTLLASAGVEYQVGVHSLLLIPNPLCEGPFVDARVDTAVARSFLDAAIAAST